mgnify:FL=1
MPHFNNGIITHHMPSRLHARCVTTSGRHSMFTITCQRMLPQLITPQLQLQHQLQSQSQSQSQSQLTGYPQLSLVHEKSYHSTLNSCVFLLSLYHMKNKSLMLPPSYPTLLHVTPKLSHALLIEQQSMLNPLTKHSLFYPRGCNYKLIHDI